MKVIILVFPKILQLEVQAKESTQFPARPQSVAEMTVVGQKPHNPLIVSVLHSKPDSAVRGLFGLPVSKSQVLW
jgi:hypothetical protein